MTAVPPASLAARIAAAGSLCTKPTLRSLSRIPQIRPTSSSWSTDAASPRQRTDRPAGIAASTCSWSGSVSRYAAASSATRNATPWLLAAASSLSVGPAGRARAPALKRERGGVPGVAVGDDRAGRCQVSRDRGEPGGIGNRPDPVPDTIAGHRLCPRRRRSGGRRYRAARRARLTAVVEEEDRLEVGLRRLHQLAAAGHRPGRDALVRPDDAGVQRFQAERPDQAALVHCHAGAVRHRLLVDVQGRVGIDPHDLPVLPGLQHPGGLTAAVAGMAAHLVREDQPDHVVRVGRHQLVLYVVGDDVVRWRGDLSQTAHPVLRITNTAKRCQRKLALPGWCWLVARRKDMHICQKDQLAARIPALAISFLAGPRALMIPTPSTSAGSSCSGAAVDRKSTRL